MSAETWRELLDREARETDRLADQTSRAAGEIRCAQGHIVSEGEVNAFSHSCLPSQMRVENRIKRTREHFASGRCAQCK